MLTRDQLKTWIDYANEHGSVILFDAAYERFIVEEGVPPFHLRGRGRRDLRHRVPLVLQDRRLHGRALWIHRGAEGARARRPEPQRHVEPSPDDKFNGASYVIQRGAAAIYTPEGARQVEETIDYYRKTPA